MTMTNTATPIETNHEGCATENDGPRIYVACLSSYVHGCLHGAWIEANQDADDIQAEIQDMLSKSIFPDAEEHAIHDFDGFGSVTLSEYEDLGDVATLAELIDEWGEELASALWHRTGGDEDETRTLMDDSYQGCYEDLESWAEQLLEDTGALNQVPEHLRCYLDLAAYVRDYELSGDIFTVDTVDGVHVFWGR